MPKVKKGFFDVSLVEILGGVVVCLLSVILAMSNGDTAKAQSDADASMVKASDNGERISSLEAHIKTISESANKMEKSVASMAESNKIISELVIRHDEAMKADRAAHKEIVRRIEKLEP